LYKTNGELCEGCVVLARILVFVFLGFWGIETSAQENHLFDADIALSAQSSKIRQQAIRQGLSEVLQRIMVAEPAEIEQDVTVQAILADAPRYVETFHTAVEALSGKQMMHVSFKKGALLARLRNGSLSFWIQSRPKILLWLVLEKEHTRGFFYPQRHETMKEMLLAKGSQLGFQPLFPLFDFDDYVAVTVSDVALNNSEKIKQVSKRYHADVILLGFVKEDTTCWQGRWSLLFREQTVDWNQLCTDLPTLIQATFRNVYRELAPKFAIHPDNQQAQDTFLIKVSGVSKLKDLHRLTEYFKTIDLIRSFYSYKIEAGDNFYEIEFNGDWNSLVNKFLLDKVIKTTQDISVMPELAEFQFWQEFNTNN
jgi:hypothetical protein